MADGSVRGEFTLTSEQALHGLRDIRDTGREADAALEQLGQRMDALGRKTVRPRVDLTGIDAANAKLTELEARLDRIGRKSYSPRVGVAGNLTGIGGGGASSPSVGSGSMGPGGLLGSAGGRMGLLPWWGALLPFAPQLAGGAGALGVSAGSAALGAGAVGLAGAGSLAAGAGLTMTIAKPAIDALGEITKAQTRYNTAVSEFGRRSTQAATAQRALNAAMTANPGAVGAARQLEAFRRDFRTATAPARAAAYAGISNVLYNARGALPTISGAALGATTAVAGAAGSFSSFLAAPAQQAMLMQLTGSFAQNLPIAERTLEHITTLFGHLAVDALPFFHQANVWVEHWTAGLARSSSDQGRVQAGMQRMVDSAKDWARLMGAGGRVLRDVFSPVGATPGNTMVESLTHTLDRWDVWLRDNPGRVRQFFADGVQGVSRIATIISNLVGDIAQLYSGLAPILSRAEQFISFASGMGGGNLLLGAGLLYGGYQGVRGAMGGGGPNPGGLLSSFIFGSSRGLTGGGGGGGTAAASSASALTRATNLEVAQGRTAAGTILLGGATTGPDAVLARRAAAQAATTADARAFSGLRSQVATMIESSPLAARVADAAAASRELALGAFSGVARFVGPLIALNGVLGALGAHGGVSQRVGAGLSQMSFGALSPAQGAAVAPGVLGALPAAALSRVAPGMLGRGAAGVLGRIIGPQALEAIGARSLGLLGGATLGGVGAYAGYMVSPANAGASLDSAHGRALVSSIASQANAVRTPAQLQAFQSRTATIPISFEMSPGDQARLHTLVQHALTVAASNAGATASSQWENAFTRGVDRGVGPQRAVRQMLAGMQTQITHLGPQGALAMARDTAQWSAQLQAADPRLQRPMRTLMEGITNDINRMNHATGDSFAELQRKVFFINGQILQGTSQAWQAIGKSLTDPASVAQEKLLGIFSQIQRESIDALTSMGYSRSQARFIVTNLGRSTQAGAIAGNTANLSRSPGTAAGTVRTSGGQNVYVPPTRERGGAIPGDGLLDTVNVAGVRAAPGEAWIANRHAMADLSSATLEKYGKTAWEIIRDEQRPHSAPPRQLGGLFGSLSGAISNAASGVANRIARGSGSGWVQRAHPELHPGIAQAVELVLSRFPLSITSTTRGGHASGSYHYLGEAADISGASGTMFSASQWIGGNLAGGLTEGIHNPNLSIKGGHGVPPSYWGPAVWAEHANHIHMAVAGALAATGALGGTGFGFSMPTPIALRAPRSGLRGIPGALADAASRSHTRGLQDRINAVIGATGISAAGFSGGGSNTANQQLGHRMMLAAGWGEDQWAALQALWNRESGWSSTAVNRSSGAAGIPQALGHGHVFNLGDAPAQIAWGLNYIRGTYGSPAAAWAHEQGQGWYERGGRVNWAGWNARGANFVTNGPTLFGAGEHGNKEQVNITPVGRGNGRPIQVIMQNVHLGSGSANELEAVAQDVAGRIIDALDRTAGGASDSSLAGG